MVGAPFARLIANLVVMGTGVLGRAFVEAYKQALASERRAVLRCTRGLHLTPRAPAADGGKAATTAAKATTRGGIAEAEARQILNVKPKASDADIAAVSERAHAPPCLRRR